MIGANYQRDHPAYLDAVAEVRGRVWELGWRAELFEQIDRGIAEEQWRRQTRPDRVERYGKKYGWIGYYELVGRLDDAGAVKERYWLGGDRIVTPDVDPTFPEEPPPVPFELPAWVKPEPVDDAAWVADGVVEVAPRGQADFCTSVRTSLSDMRRTERSSSWSGASARSLLTGTHPRSGSAPCTREALISGAKSWSLSRRAASPRSESRALYNGADLAVSADDTPDATAGHGLRHHVMDAQGRLAKVRVAGSNPVVPSTETPGPARGVLLLTCRFASSVRPRRLAEPSQAVRSRLGLYHPILCRDCAQPHAPSYAVEVTA